MNSDLQSPEVENLPAEEETSLPFLRSWPHVYGFVIVVFLVYTILLTILSRVFA